MSRQSSRSTQRQGDAKPKNVKASWSNIYTSIVLRILIACVMVVVIAERTFAWIMMKTEHVPIEFLLASGWLIAILSMVSAGFALVGVLQDRDL